jgi:arylsulfatase A-like enzyme
LLLLGLVAGCPASAEPTAPGGPPASPGAVVAPSAVAMPGGAAPGPIAAGALDLVANRIRLHAYDRGLVVPLLGEGFRIYDQDYQSGWGEVVEAGGVRVRALRRSAATLTLPWPGGPAALVVRGAALGKLTVAVDGKRRAAAVVDDALAATTIDLGALPAGEHELALTAAKAKGGLASVELTAPDAAAGCVAEPGAIAATVGGWPRLQLLVEVPRDGAVELVATGPADAAAAAEVVAEDGTRTALWRGVADGGHHVVSLARWADQLVALELLAPGCQVRWQGTRLGPTAVTVAPRAAPAQNLVLIVVDTLRGDHLTVDGPTRVTTPRITAAAAHGVVFRHDQAMAPSSPPSHATIQTGQIPRVHGAAGDKGAIKADAPVLAKLLGAAGFYTGYIGDNDFAMMRFKGPGGWREFHTPSREGKGIDCKAIVAGTLAMARTAHAAGQRFFVSALPVEPHVPYRFHDGITQRYYAGPFDPPFGKEVSGEDLDHIKTLALTPHSFDQLRGLYDGEVTYFDGCFGALLDGLAALGVADDTAVILASDHGEGMGERGGRVGHAYSLNNELVSVPLVVLGGGVPAAVVDVVTSNADIAPTALELLGLPGDPRMQGRSLVPLALAGGRAPQRVVASEYGKSLAIRALRWHYVVDYDGHGKLFDVVADPGEAHDQTRAAPLALRYVRDAAGLYLAHRVAWRAARWGGLADLAADAPLGDTPAAPAANPALPQ